MGQKTNPIANRLGIIKGWDSNWYGGNDYSAKLVEDNTIRVYLTERLAKASISPDWEDDSAFLSASSNGLSSSNACSISPL